MVNDTIWEVIDLAGDDLAAARSSKLQVVSSPKIELALVAAMLAAPEISPGHYGTLDHPITHAARDWFMPYADHPATATFRKIFYLEEFSSFACDAVTSFILQRTDPPDLARRGSHPASALKFAGGESRNLDDLVDQLRDLYYASDFAGFWQAHADAYRQASVQVAESVGKGWAGEDVVATMEGYFGQGKVVYILVPSPMERPGGGSMVMLGDRQDCIVPCFDCTVSADWILYLLYHEAGHSFVNPLADKYERLVKRYESLYLPLKEAMRPWGYLNWKVALNEHVLRAQNCRLRRLLMGEKAADEQLEREESQGFRYIRALDARLAEYEAQRDRYPSLDVFYPALLSALDPFLA